MVPTAIGSLFVLLIGGGLFIGSEIKKESGSSHGFRHRPPSLSTDFSLDSTPDIEINDTFISSLIIKSKPSVKVVTINQTTTLASPSKKPTEGLFFGNKKKATAENLSIKPGSMFASPTLDTPLKTILVSATSQYRAVLTQDVDGSIKQSIIMATILSGPLKGGKVLGQRSFQNDRCYIQFHTLIWNKKEISIYSIAQQNSQDGIQAVNESNPVEQVFNSVKDMSGSLLSAYLRSPLQSYSPDVSQAQLSLSLDGTRFVVKATTVFDLFFQKGVQL
jgi:hypothetical protein